MVPMIVSNARGFAHIIRVNARPVCRCDRCDKIEQLFLLIRDARITTQNLCLRCADRFFVERWPHLGLEEKDGEQVAKFSYEELRAPVTHPKF